MSKDVVFECTHCHQWLEAPPDMANLFVECPKCETVIKVPSSSSVVPTSKKREFTPPPESIPSSGNEQLSSTIRIDLPPNLGIPQTPKRRLTIRRKN